MASSVPQQNLVSCVMEGVCNPWEEILKIETKHPLNIGVGDGDKTVLCVFEKIWRS